MIGLKWIFSGVFHGIERYKDCLESQATKAGQTGKLIRKVLQLSRGGVVKRVTTRVADTKIIPK